MDSFAMTVKNTDIYECSYGAAEFSNCSGLAFENCRIRDCDDDRNCIYLYGSEMTWDGQPLFSGTHSFQGEEYLGELIYD